MSKPSSRWNRHPAGRSSSRRALSHSRLLGFLPVAVAACVGLLVLAPIATAQSPGAISGTVTEAGSSTPLSGIGIEAFQPGHESVEGDSGYTTSAANGKYTVPNLNPGSYTVEFYPIYNTHANVLAQYYNNKTLQQTPDPVAVSSGFTAAGVNAKMQPGATISGTVTSAGAGHEPISGITVIAEKTSGGTPAQEGYWETTETTANGSYELAGLPSGEYKIRFEPDSFFFAQNYLGQYYAGGPLKVKVGEAKSGVNAELLVGGEISGTVTDAVSHVAVAEIGVGAYNQGAGIGGGTYTSANGEYTIAGLPTGTYKVLFEQEVTEPFELKYLPQYFDFASSLASATIVNVIQGSDTKAIDVALLRTVPVIATAPVLFGTPALGQALSCSNGAWTGSPTLLYTYAWQRDGAAIGGASGASYVVQGADQGHSLGCQVTATNSYGHATASSNTLVVATAVATTPPPPPVPRVLLAPHSRLAVSAAGTTHVQITCQGAVCRGVVELLEQITVRRHGSRSHRRTIVLAKAAYTLSPSHSATLVLHLTATGRRGLAHARRHQLSTTLAVSLVGGNAARGAAILRLAAPRRR